MEKKFIRQSDLVELFENLVDNFIENKEMSVSITLECEEEENATVAIQVNRTGTSELLHLSAYDIIEDVADGYDIAQRVTRKAEDALRARKQEEQDLYAC